VYPTGSQFIVVGDKDVVILKSIETPSMQDFDEMIAKARTPARKTGLEECDI
jgi:hypothetical protein